MPIFTKYFQVIDHDFIVGFAQQFPSLVFCHHFAAALLLDSGFPSGTTSQPIWLRNLQCTGSESSLINCPSSLTAAFCGHDQDVGVVCAATGCTEGALRLQGGNITRGYVEICHSNLWGPVCDWSWSDDEARVACLQLGLPSSSVWHIAKSINSSLPSYWYLQ